MTRFCVCSMALGFLVGSSGCLSNAGTSLVVELQTDFIVGQEFSSFEVEVDGVPTRTNVESSDTDLYTGRTLPGFTGLSPSVSRRLSVRLINASGAAIGETQLVVSNTVPKTLRVIVSRECLGVTCEDGQTCWGGECVAEGCIVGQTSCAMSECTANSECVSSNGMAISECAQGVCSSGVCLFVPSEMMCGNGEWCDPLNGCTTGSAVDCSDSQECRSTNECSSGTCDMGECSFENVEDGAACASGVCVAGVCQRCADNSDCSEGWTCSDNVCIVCSDDTQCAEGVCIDGGCVDCRENSNCNDGSVCTTDQCVDNVCRSTAVTDGTACADGSCLSGQCAADSCTDGVKGQAESDIDCGGECPGCSSGKACDEASDCASELCQNGTCETASCDDGMQNGSETGVDCGGTCPACSLCQRQSQLPENECEALSDFFQATNGSDWTGISTRWLSNDRPCSWDGVVCASGHVTVLDLSRKNVVGSVPASFSDLTELQTLRMPGNRIAGTITNFVGLTELRVLQVAGNRLIGSIPSSISDLADLEAMDLSGNQLSGSIPRELGDLSKLVSLYLSNNRLSGNLLSPVYSSPSLRDFFIQDNQLQGIILQNILGSGIQNMRLRNNGCFGAATGSVGAYCASKDRFWNCGCLGTCP